MERNSLMSRKKMLAPAALGVLLSAFFGSPATGQDLPHLYRITGGVSANHMEYHQMNISKGREFVLADLKGPGKVTYFYITDDSR
jgi:hypothetical protein